MFHSSPSASHQAMQAPGFNNYGRMLGPGPLQPVVHAAAGTRSMFPRQPQQHHAPNISFSPNEQQDCSFDLPQPVLSNGLTMDEDPDSLFAMFSFKIAFCKKEFVHDWCVCVCVCMLVVLWFQLLLLSIRSLMSSFVSAVQTLGPNFTLNI